MTVEVKVFEGDNETEVCNLSESRQVRAINGRDLLESGGDGSVSIDWDHPDVGELTQGRIIQVHEDGRVPLSFTLDKKVTVNVPADGRQSSRLVTVSGATLRGVLSRARAMPWLPVASSGVPDQRPITRRLLFNAASPIVDRTSWITPYQQDRVDSQPSRPRGWPSNDAKWLWGEEEDEMMTIGTCWFVREFTLEADATVVFLVTADDRFVEFLEGAEMQREEPKFPANVWPDPWRSPMKLKAGTYTYGVAATNDGGKGAVMAEAWRVTTEGLDTRIFMTGFPLDDEFDAQYGEWLCLPYPGHGDAGYGHTIGQVVEHLVGKAQDRGEIPAVTLGFDAELDSNGDAWDWIAEIDCDATGKLADALDKFAETYCDVRMSYSDGLQLDLYRKGARGSATAISLDGSQIRSDIVEENLVVENDVLLARDRGIYQYESPLSVLAYGRLPGGSLPVGQIDDEGELDALGAQQLDGLTNPSESRVIEIHPQIEFPAEPGDTITVAGDSGLRVVEIGFDFEQGGKLRKQPALSTPYQERRKNAERVVARMIAEAGTSLAGARPLDTGSNIPSGRLSPVKITSWSWTDPEDLDTEFWDTEEEDPVGWQPYPLEEAVRVWAIIVECYWAEPDGAGGIAQVTTGQSRFSMQIDGGPAPVPLIATVPETSGTSDPSIFGIQYVFGPALVAAGRSLSVVPIENGGHINGSVTIWTTEAL